MNELSALLVQLKHECSFESFFVISVHHISRQIYTAIMYVEETFPDQPGVAERYASRIVFGSK